MNTTSHGQDQSINSRSSLIAAIYLSVVGPAVFIVQPGFVQGLVEYGNFSDIQAGYISSAEMWGIALSTFALVFLTRLGNWQRVLRISAVVIMLGNFASVLSDDYWLFMLLRFVTGLGSGGLISLSFTIIGLTSNPDRNFGLQIMWILAYGALGLLLMPMAYTHIGLDGVLIFFALFGISSLIFIGRLPDNIPEENHLKNQETSLTKKAKNTAVLSMFVYFLAQGVVWTYLFLLGLQAGLNEQNVSNGLTVSQLAGVAGAMLAAIMANRFGRLMPLSLGIAASIISLFLLYGGQSAWQFAALVSLFNFAWNMTHPYLLAAMASFDRSGRMVVYAVAAQMFGIAIGPAIAANIINDGDYQNILTAGIILFALAWLLISPPVLAQAKEQQ